MIPDVDDTLRRMLSQELGKLPGCPVYDAEQITFDPPTEAASAQDGEARVNLYLHDIRENLDLRDETFLRVRSDRDESMVGIRRAPVRINLAYLVTVHAGHDPATEHRLMANVLGVLLTYLAVPSRFLSGTLEGLTNDAVLMSVAQPDDLELFNPSSLWQALESQMQPSLILIITAPFNPFETKWTKRVREMVYGTGRGSEQNAMVRPDNVTNVRLSMAGIVLDQQTEVPLIGVQVEIEELAKAVTDEQGLFSLTNLPTGVHKVRFSRRGYKVGEMDARVPPPGRTDQVEPLVMALHLLSDSEREAETAALAAEARNAPDIINGGRPSLVSLTGTVRLASGAPASFVNVRAAGKETLTDADGVYSFFDLPPGKHRVVATIPGQGDTDITESKSS